LEAVIRSWNVVCGGTSSKYLSLSDNDIKCNDSVHWFFKILFDHFVKHHPSASRMFENVDIVKLSYTFSSVFGDILGSITNPNEIHATLMEIALTQSKR
jgi:hypothetical protein